MVGENVESHMSQMAKNALKLSTMVGENLEICWSQMAKNAFKFNSVNASTKIFKVRKKLWRTFRKN